MGATARAAAAIAGMIDLLGSARANPENPQTDLSNPAAWLYNAMGGGASITGAVVNAKTALTLDTVWRAVNLISTDVGKLPLHIHRRLPGDRGKERATGHVAYQLLRHKPNREMTAKRFRETLQQHGLLHGNGYAYIFRDVRGRPQELIPLNPTATVPVRVNGDLHYVTQIATSTTADGKTPVGGEQRKLAAADVIHIAGLGWDGLAGHSWITMARESLGLGLAMRDHTARFFANGAEPGVVLEHPGKLSPEAAQALAKQWNDMHSGLNNAHKTAVLEAGMKANTIALNARDAQLIQGRQFSVNEVANWFSVPPHKLGAKIATSYKSLEQENLAYLTDTLDGWLVTWEEECRDKLLSDGEKTADTHIVEFERKALVRADLMTRAAYLRIALAGRPWLTPNEGRRIENLNTLDDDTSDLRIDPANIIGKPTAPGGTGGRAGTTTRLQHSLHSLLADAVGRMARRIGAHARQAAKKPKTFPAWLNGFENEHAGVVRDALTGPLDAIRTAGDAEPDVMMPAATAAALCSVVRDALDELLDVPQSRFADAVDERMAELERDLPEQIADGICNPDAEDTTDGEA